MANVGFVGLGVMGSEMVLRLLEKGHRVTGYNRTRAKCGAVDQKGHEMGGIAAACCFRCGRDSLHGDEFGGAWRRSSTARRGYSLG